MFKILKGVQLQGNAPGQAYGGGIYSMSCSLGQSGEATKVTLSIVSATGIYNPPAPNVTSTGRTSILIGDSTGSTTIHRLYPYKYTENSTAGSKTITVSFVDQGAALNKIWVGLAARHSAFHTVSKMESFDFSVRCLECNTLWPHMVESPPGNVDRTSLTAGGSVGTHGAGAAFPVGFGNGTIDGGYVIVGSEKFTDGNCEVPQVEYTFGELCSLLSGLGFDHNLNQFQRSTFYTAAYSGTLKEVLTSWAADFSFSFIIDPFSSNLTIVGHDLTRQLSLAPVNAALNAGFRKGSPGGGLIRTRSQTHSAEGTYAQAPIIRNLKPARGFSRQQTSYQEVTGKPVTIQDAIGNEAHLGRTDAQLMVSIALAKYQAQARLIWLSDQAAKAWILNQPLPRGPFPSLGFIPHKDGYITDAQTKTHLLELFGGASVGGSAFKHPVWGDPRNYMVFVGVYNPEDQAKTEAFDKELADFYGKYWYFHGQGFNAAPLAAPNVDYPAGIGRLNGAPAGMVNPPPNDRQCPETGWAGAQQHKYYDFASNITTLPNGDFYKGRSYPFKNILRANNGAFAGAHASPRGDYIFPVEDNAWGTHPEQVEEAFENQWVLTDPDGPQWGRGDASAITDLAHFLPIYSRFNSDRVMGSYLRDILPNFDLNFMAGSNQTKGYFPGIAIIPNILMMKATNFGGAPVNGVLPKERVLEVGVGGPNFGLPPGMQNDQAYDNQRRRILKYHAGARAKKTCITYCEEDIVSDICKCPDIQDPIHRWKNVPMLADFVKLTHLKNEVNLIFPAMKDYKAFWKAEVVWRGTYPKAVDIHGSPPSAPIGNVMESRVVDYDVSSLIDPQPETNSFKQKFVLNGWLHDVVDLAQYSNNVQDMSVSSYDLTETISVKLDGISYDTLWPYINPSSGLVSFSVTVDGEGMSTDLTFSSHPPKPPKRDIWMQKFNAMSNSQRALSVTPDMDNQGGMPMNP